MKIVSVNTSDKMGGASRVAWNLFRTYGEIGHNSKLMVGYKSLNDQNVIQINPNTWCRNTAVVDRLVMRLRWMKRPFELVQVLRGLENFNYPRSWKLLNMLPDVPDIVHLHNLHGSYFDLRCLPVLSMRLPVVITLHDAWLLSGHCAHSFSCEKWKSGCGDCPDLNIPPSIRRDSTMANWKRKQDIYSRSSLYIAAPSEWLMNKIKGSMLMNGTIQCRVIPNGVDLEIFKMVDKTSARMTLNLPLDAKIISFSGCGQAQSVWRDNRLFDKLISALKNSSYHSNILILLLGGGIKYERFGSVTVRYIPYQEQNDVMAKYYQSSDLFVHPALEDTFPSSVLEAMACGTPVVSTKVGGIAEQVVDGQTGFLVPAGDDISMFRQVMHLLDKPDVCVALGKNSTVLAHDQFSLEKQCGDYVQWFRDILSVRRRAQGN